MSYNINDIIQYRIEKSERTFLEAKSLKSSQFWNGAVNRLYYTCYHIVSALLIKDGINASTHNGVRSQFFKYYIKTENAAYYAVIALLLSADLKPTTHNGAKSNFSEYFIKTGKIDKESGKIFSQLFTWRQKGDYDDLFDFQKEKVLPYFEPVKDVERWRS